jgi:hypothetical protein
LDGAVLGELVQDAVDAAEIRRAIARFGAGALAFDRGLGCASLRVAICSANGTGVDSEQEEAEGKRSGDLHLEPPVASALRCRADMCALDYSAETLRALSPETGIYFSKKQLRNSARMRCEIPTRVGDITVTGAKPYGSALGV